MLTCREASRLVSEGLDRHLPWTRRLSLRLHLMMCRGCSRFRRQVEGLDRLVRRCSKAYDVIEQEETLSPAMRERIKAAARDADR